MCAIPYSDSAVDRNLLSGMLFFFLSSLFLAGCSSKPPPQPPTQPESEPPPTVAPTPPPEPEKRIKTDSMGNPLDPNTGAPLSRIFYFEYDEAIIARDDFDALSLHAVFLQENRALSATLEGHCDERGTRDYNLALGENRASAVSRFLVSSGAGGSQISTVSYGEERPANPNSSEAAWAQNRRVEIIYQ